MRNDWRRWLLFLFLLVLLAYGVLTALPGMLAYGARGAADFSIFYTGASILRHGLAPRLYDLAVQAHFQSPFYRSHPLPFNHFAFELLLFLPFPSVSFFTAFWIWDAINLLLLAIFAWLISPEVKSLPRPVGMFVFVAGFAFFPVIAALMEGQDSILLLLIYAVVYRLLKMKKKVLAGFVLAAALIKFPLLIPFLVPFLFRKQWGFLGGFLAGTITVVGVSIAITGLSGFVAYVELLQLLASHPDLGYTAMQHMPIARGFFETVLPHMPVFRIVFVAGISMAVLAVAILRFRKPGEEGFDRWFALNITTALAVCPHLYRHDLTVLFLALLLSWNAYLGSVSRRAVDEGNRKRNVAERAGLVLLTLIFFATPLYQLLNYHGGTSLMFVPLLLFCVISAASVSNQSFRHIASQRV